MGRAWGPWTCANDPCWTWWFRSTTRRRSLEHTVRTTRAFLDGFTYPTLLTIADNASHRRDARTSPGVSPPSSPRCACCTSTPKGRGRALQGRLARLRRRRCWPTWTWTCPPTWRRSLPLVAPLVSGHSAPRDRHAAGPRVAGRARRRSARSSRAATTCCSAARSRSGFSDAQCGFKAIRSDVAARAAARSCEDTGWFFDTELLVLAERAGLRIHEVPVDWVDDPDSRVDVVATARADLAGIGTAGARPRRRPAPARRGTRAPARRRRRARGPAEEPTTGACCTSSSASRSSVACPPSRTLLLFLWLRVPAGIPGCELCGVAGSPPSPTPPPTVSSDVRHPWPGRSRCGTRAKASWCSPSAWALSAGSLWLLQSHRSHRPAGRRARGGRRRQPRRDRPAIRPDARLGLPNRRPSNLLPRPGPPWNGTRPMSTHLARDYSPLSLSTVAPPGGRSSPARALPRDPPTKTGNTGPPRRPPGA